MTPLPDAFLGAPLAHRGLHGPGVPENSRAAIAAAIAAGYGIEIDVQMSSDAVPMVFHDDTLDRLTDHTGPVRAYTADALSRIALPDGDGIPTLAEILTLVAGRAALLVEIKDQSGTLGPDIGALEQATATTLRGYRGPVAVMSFNPHSVAAFGTASPETPRGLTSDNFVAEHWPGIPEPTLASLRDMPLFERIGASFLSHQAADLTSPRVAQLKARGVPVLCWTIRSPDQERIARQIADNITFEGYQAPLP